MATSRWSTFRVGNRELIRCPAGVHTRCGRSPPEVSGVRRGVGIAGPASAVGSLRVGRDRLHSIGVESICEVSSAHTSVSVARRRIIRQTARRSGAAACCSPICLTRQIGEQVGQMLGGVTSQPVSLLWPSSSACITANVSNSASDNFGAIPTRGRHGAQSGPFFKVSSVGEQIAIARVSRSASTKTSKVEVGLQRRSWTPHHVTHGPSTPWN